MEQNNLLKNNYSNLKMYAYFIECNASIQIKKNYYLRYRYLIYAITVRKL